MEPLYLEDFEPGQTFESGAASVSADDIIRFASEFDPQPFHTDPEAARATFFGGLAASGWHTAALAMSLSIDAVTIAGGLIGAGVEAIEWMAPVRPGDHLKLVIEVVKVVPSKSRPDRGIVHCFHKVLNQSGNVVMTFQPKLVVPRRSFANSDK